MNPFTPIMMALFEGHMNAYGQFKEEGTVRNDGKIKGSGITKREKVHPTLWDEHLNGTKQLGIVPINEDSKCKFGAIDIDDYDVDKELINIKIVTHKIPVVMFRSKSGGCHLYLFCRELVNAELMQRKLKEIASFLGHGEAEIFPKQIKILKERGDVGQWINMPYFDSAKSIRYCIRSEDNEKLSLKGFTDYVSEKLLDPSQLEGLKMQIDESLPGGPPCLQVLCSQGFPDGTRNSGLFAVGVYAKKRDPDKWKTLVEQYNQEFMKPPLSPKEVLSTIGSLDKKDYNYPCKKQPICAHCDMSLCRTRKYGVGVSSGLPSMGTLSKLNTEPPIWFVDVDGERLQLSTEELQNPRLFQGKCLKHLNIMPILPKQNEWAFIVQNLLENVVDIDVPGETTATGQLWSHLEEFCVGRGHEEKDVLLRGLVYNHEGWHYFRYADFILFLERKRFVAFGSNVITSILRDKGVEHHGINVHKGKFVSCYRVKMFVAPPVEFKPPVQTSEIPY